MQVKQVLYLRRRLYSGDRSEQTIESETIIVDDLVVIAWNPHGLHSYYKNLEHYMEKRFQYYSIDNMETDIHVIDIGEC